jgi:hypothetical protein
MAVPISNVVRRIVFAPSGTGPYAFTFEILAATDIEVYRGDTLLTLTTDYTVTINPNGTGEVTLVATAGTENVTIIGARTIQRTTDFVTGGDLFANSLNEELDSLTIFAQQNSEAVARALQAPETDPTTINMVLPRAADRANKNLAFDNNGNPIIGELIGDWKGDWSSGQAYAKRDLIKDTTNDNVYICIVAHTSSGSLPITTNTDAAKWDLVVDASAAAASAAAAASSASAASTSATNASNSASAASTSATNASNSASAASTSATNASNAQTAAESARDATLAAFDSFDDRYLGVKTADPTLDNDGNALVAGALYFNSVAGVMKVYTGSAWVAAYVSGDAASIGFSPAGDISATNVQAAIEELDTEKIATTAIGSTVQAFDADTAKTDVAQTFTAKQTFGTTTKIEEVLEKITVSATAATGTINFDALTQGALYYTTNASGNWTLNVRGDSGTSLDTMMATGESLTVVFLVTQGSTAYYNSAFQVDGSSVTPKWLGGEAPTEGTASSIDAYTYVIVKTGSATFTVFASVVAFA